MRINLAWSDNSPNEQYFKVERSTDGVTFAQLIQLGANQTSYSDATLTAGLQYWYRVKASNGVGDSSYTNVATSITARPAAPTGLSVAIASASSISLAWTDNSVNESGFKVERSTDGTTFAQVAVTGVNATTFTDAGLVAGTKYWYRVRATNALGDSSYSNQAATTPR